MSVNIFLILYIYGLKSQGVRESEEGGGEGEGKGRLGRDRKKSGPKEIQKTSDKETRFSIIDTLTHDTRSLTQPLSTKEEQG